VRLAEVGAESALPVVHFHTCPARWFMTRSRKRETTPQTHAY
jgi:hypothetical protein